MTNNLSKKLTEYYSKRANNYEKIYNRQDKIRRKEQEIIASYIKNSFKNKYVLEIACGTGYWTKYLIDSATKVISIDSSLEMLAIAAKRYASHSLINFLQMDAYIPPKTIPSFTASLACLWFSHIPKNKIKTFLTTLHSRLAPDSTIIFVDNIYRENLGGKLIRRKNSLDTWKRRKLARGEEYDILKNYYSKEELLDIFSVYCKEIKVEYLTYFWLVKYRLLK